MPAIVRASSRKSPGRNGGLRPWAAALVLALTVIMTSGCVAASTEELEENDGSLGSIRALRWAVFRGKAALSMSEVIAAAEAQGCPKSTLVRDFWQADKADALAWSEQCARHRWEC